MAMAYGIFRQSLQDLVKGIRANGRNEEEYVKTKLIEIREESKSADPTTKTNAVLKLVHLQMFGYSMAESSFQVVEVLSRPEYANKRVGYLAAMQSFSPTTDVLLLCTNQIKKDLTSGRMCSQALGCLAKIVTEELGAECGVDVARLLTSSRSYIRKKAVLVLYRVGLVYEECLKAVMPRLRERLNDSDPAVVCVTVTVICELARRSPEKYLSFAPDLYKLLNRSENNWTLIKIVKLMGTLTPLEPRLGKKLVEPLTRLMTKTRAKSLLFECCNTVTLGLTAHQGVVELCAKRLGEFIVDKDQNLKYLGLLALRRVARDCPSIALEHRDLILDCLDDDDVGIRTRALELISEFISRRNLREVSRILLSKLRVTAAQSSPNAAISTVEQSDRGNGTDVEAQFQEALEERLLTAGLYSKSADKTGFVYLVEADDFDWYIRTILYGLATTYGLSEKAAKSVGSQILDLAVRVQIVQATTADCAFELLGGPSAHGPTSSSLCHNPSLLSACVWVVGEYASCFGDPGLVLKTLISLDRDMLRKMPQSRVIFAAMKVFCQDEALNEGELRDRLLGWLAELRVHSEVEVQEQAAMAHALVSASQEDVSELRTLFAGELKPVDPRAQGKLPCPKDLDLSSAVCVLSDIESDGSEDVVGNGNVDLDAGFQAMGLSHSFDEPEPTVRTNGLSKEARKADPFYLDGGSSAPAKRGSARRKPRRNSDMLFQSHDSHSPRASTGHVQVALDAAPEGVVLSEEEAERPKRATGRRRAGGKKGGRRKGKSSSKGPAAQPEVSLIDMDESFAPVPAAAGPNPRTKGRSAATLTADDLLG